MRLFFRIIFLIIFSSLNSCGNRYHNDIWKDIPPKSVTGISLKDSTTILAGNSETLYPEIMPPDAYDRRFSWTSSVPSIASVNDNGTVTGIAKGTAVISVITSDGEHKAECSVTVSSIEIHVTGISLTEHSVSISDGNYHHLSAEISPTDATNQNLDWASSDVSIVTVDSGGTIHAEYPGTAEITVRTRDGLFSDSCNITVTVLEVEAITLDPASLSMVPGAISTITATISPQDATDKTLIWKSGNSAVATVTNGAVSAIAIGNAVITAENASGSVKAECTVKVLPVSVSSIDIGDSTLSVKAGKSASLTASISPSNASDTTITWSSSDTQIVQVNSSGDITALKKGTAVVTAKANGGVCSDTCTVTVTDINVTGISLTVTSCILTTATGLQLTATITPSDATNKSLTWTSSDSSIAAVSNTGYASGISAGSAVITATSDDGGFTATCLINVQAIDVISVSLTPSNISIKEFASTTLSAAVSPSNATNQTIIWSSNNPGVASVDNNGTVTGIMSGIATISAIAYNGITVSCAVTVTGASILDFSYTRNGAAVTLYWNNPTDITIQNIEINYYDQSDSLIKTILTDSSTIQSGASASKMFTLTSGIAYSFQFIITDSSGNKRTSAMYYVPDDSGL